MELRREMGAAGCVGAEDNSQGHFMTSTLAYQMELVF